jgi:hypothetical protein
MVLEMYYVIRKMGFIYNALARNVLYNHSIFLILAFVMTFLISFSFLFSAVPQPPHPTHTHTPPLLPDHQEGLVESSAAHSLQSFCSSIYMYTYIHIYIYTYIHIYIYTYIHINI